jgi:AcrR family transcriptional regulator
MAVRADVTPNRRGTRSREAVLDAAERLMAKHGYEGATITGLVEEAGIPTSSIYHYFGSKDGVLLAVMERGADRFFNELPEGRVRQGRRAVDHLQAMLEATARVLDRHPNFLRLLIVLAAQPPDAADGEVHAVVNRVRDKALRRLRGQMALAFGIAPESEQAHRLARFALASIDGAFVAQQADPSHRIADVLGPLPSTLVAMRRELSRG